MNTQSADTSSKDSLHLEGELYLGYASFAHFVKNVYGYQLLRSGKEHLVMCEDGVFIQFELTLDCPNAECGYVYVGSATWGEIYAVNPDLSQCLSGYCRRPKGRLPYGEKDWHCHINESLWGKITVTLNSGETVRCKHPLV